MTRPTIHITIDGCRSTVCGYGTRSMVEDLTGRAPARFQAGYSVSEKVARDVLALATERNLDIVVGGPRSSSSLVADLVTSDVSADASADVSADQGALW